MILYVDKLEEFDLGGYTTDIMKIRYALKKFKMNVDKIVKDTPMHIIFPSGGFHAGRYVVLFKLNRELTDCHLAFINYEINLEENFNVFADSLSPKTIGAFFSLQNIIKLKDDDKLKLVELSDRPIFIENLFEN